MEFLPSLSSVSYATRSRLKLLGTCKSLLFRLLFLSSLLIIIVMVFCFVLFFERWGDHGQRSDFTRI